jgi:hypothetical protein
MDRLVHVGANPEQLAIAKEFAELEKDALAKAAERRERALALIRRELQALRVAERGLLVTWFVDVWHIADQDVARTFDKSEVWVRVCRYRARHTYPCGDAGIRECRSGLDCAHQRGHQIFNAVAERLASSLAEFGDGYDSDEV